MQTRLSFTYPDFATDHVRTLLLVGRKERLLAESTRAQLPSSVLPLWARMLERTVPGDGGAATFTWTGQDGPEKVVACVLPERCSRYNSPAHPHAITALLRREAPKKGDIGVLIALDQAKHAFAAGCAVARAFSRYENKQATGSSDKERRVTVGFTASEGDVVGLERIDRAADAIRFAARLVDMPTSELNTTTFIELVRSLELDVEINLIRGQELADSGYGGLWGVGKAARHPPALMVLSYEPKDAQRTIALVGKGIVYDTGGLSIKGKMSMPGMKGDMGGAAAVLGAFVAAVELGSKDRLHCVLCLAENSVGPDSFRPDDVLTMYSGKTVEVNNTDAEGRLVLADGVAFAAKNLAPDVIVDVATLTGAQLVATGKRHAAIVCNDEDLEALTVQAGLSSGDLVHPLPYVPEFFRKEFRSPVANMKNSVKDRMNAQSSCAAQFVAEHLCDYDGPWLHVDIAGPSESENRGTGFGVALLLDLFGPR